jgi:hypothetical protein
MKLIFFAAALVTTVFFSCQNANKDNTANENASTDSVVDSAAMPPDTLSGATEAEIIAAENAFDEQPVTDPDNFDYVYEGLINNKIKVRVNIFQHKGEAMARAVYLNSKKIINMEATFPSAGTFILTEKIGGKSTGIWNIAVEEEDILSGTWSAPDGSKKMPIQLGMTDGDFDDFLNKEEIKTGFYVLQETNEDAETKQEFPLLYSEELFVKNMAGNTIYFDLYIQGSPPGMHVGMVNGMAEKSGNSYLYKNDEGCEITMSFAGDSVQLSQKGTDINCGFGANIGVFGTLKIAVQGDH